MTRKKLTRLQRAIAETKEHLELNGGGDDEGFVSDDDAIEDLMSECGQDGSGYCHATGSEYCDFECPFRD